MADSTVGMHLTTLLLDSPNSSFCNAFREEQSSVYQKRVSLSISWNQSHPDRAPSSVWARPATGRAAHRGPVRGHARKIKKRGDDPHSHSHSQSQRVVSLGLSGCPCFVEGEKKRPTGTGCSTAASRAERKKKERRVGRARSRGNEMRS